MAQPAATFPSLGSYEVIRKLGAGGMAEVFLARQRMAVGVERPVVIKSILAHLAEDRTFVSMFLREARIASLLSHPNLVQIYDVSIIEDRPCIVMEFLRGRDLSFVLRRAAKKGERVSPEAAATIAAQAAAGLDHAHRRRDERGRRLDLVHRDVSPHNIFLTREGQARILDFGIAKSSYQQQQKQTQGGSLKGKLAYMAPEQARGFDLDGRADQWALGVVLWETLTSRRLFARADPYHTMNEVFHGAIPPPSSIDPAIPAELDAIVLRMLEREIVQRFESCDEVARELRRFVAARGSPNEIELVSQLLERTVPPEEDIEFYGFDARGTGTAIRLPEGDATKIDRGTELTFGDGDASGPDAAVANAGTALLSKPTRATPPPTVRAPKRRWRVVAALGAGFTLCGAVGMGLALVVVGNDDSAPPPSTIARREPTESVHAPSAPTSAPASILIRVRNVPDGVRVELDGSEVTSEIETLARTAPRVIRLVGPDGEVWRTEQVFEDDAVVTVPDLAREPATPRPARPRARRPRPAGTAEPSIDTNYP